MFDASLLPNNHSAFGISNRMSSVNAGQYAELDTNLNVVRSVQHTRGNFFGPIVLQDSSYLFNSFLFNNNLSITNNAPRNVSQYWEVPYGNFINNSIVVVAFKKVGNGINHSWK